MICSSIYDSLEFYCTHGCILGWVINLCKKQRFGHSVFTMKVQMLDRDWDPIRARTDGHLVSNWIPCDLNHPLNSNPRRWRIHNVMLFFDAMLSQQKCCKLYIFKIYDSDYVVAKWISMRSMNSEISYLLWRVYVCTGGGEDEMKGDTFSNERSVRGEGAARL